MLRLLRRSQSSKPSAATAAIAARLPVALISGTELALPPPPHWGLPAVGGVTLSWQARAAFAESKYTEVEIVEMAAENATELAIFICCSLGYLGFPRPFPGGVKTLVNLAENMSELGYKSVFLAKSGRFNRLPRLKIAPRLPGTSSSCLLQRISAYKTIGSSRTE